MSIHTFALSVVSYMFVSLASFMLGVALSGPPIKKNDDAKLDKIFEILMRVNSDVFHLKDKLEPKPFGGFGGIKASTCQDSRNVYTGL